MTSDLFSPPPGRDPYDFVTVDTETTGLYPHKGDRLVEIGAVRVRGGKVVETFGALIDPGRSIPAEATRVSRISTEMVTGSPAAGEVLPAWLKFVGEETLVCQNAPFDLAFIGLELERAGLPPLRNTVLDTRLLARCFWPQLGGFGLGRLAAHAGVPVTGRHRAVGDARTTAGVFLALLAEANRAGIATVEGLVDRCREQESAPAAPAEILGLLARSLARSEDVLIRYPTRPGWRRVTPRRLEDRYLTAFCSASGKELTFRLDRIQEARPASESEPAA